MLLPLLAAWTATYAATTTVVGPDGEPDVRPATLAASWEEGEGAFAYTIDYGAEGPATRIVCPLEFAGEFMAGGLDRERCAVFSRPSGAGEFRPGFGDAVWDSARFPFHLIERTAAAVPFAMAGVAGEAGAAPTLARPFLPELAEETELSDATGAITVGKRIEYEGALWLGEAEPAVVAGRVLTRMYYEIKGKSHGVWQPFTEQTLEFRLEGWLLPPPAPDSQAERPLAVVETSKGEFTIELFTDAAPQTAGNFMRLAEAGYFDATACHRVVEGFVDQCGDPTGTGWGGPGYSFANETGGGVRHDQWAVSMANSGPDTNGSQWFVTVGRIPRLDGSYSVFGTVVEGTDVVRAINRVAVDGSDRPLEPVVIYGVTIVGGGEAGEFPEPAVELFDAVALAGEAQYRVVWGDPEDAEPATHDVLPQRGTDMVSVAVRVLGDAGVSSVRTLIFTFDGYMALVPSEGAEPVFGRPWALPGSWLYAVDGEWELVAWPGEAAGGEGEGDLYHLAWRSWVDGRKVPVSGLVAYREFPEEEAGDDGG